MVTGLSIRAYKKGNFFSIWGILLYTRFVFLFVIFNMGSVLFVYHFVVSNNTVLYRIALSTQFVTPFQTLFVQTARWSIPFC